MAESRRRRRWIRAPLAPASGQSRTTMDALAPAWLIAHPDVAALTTAPSRTSPHLALVDAAPQLVVSDDDASAWSSWFQAAVHDPS